MTLEPTKRSWSEREGGRRDVDGFRRARMAKAFVWAAFPAVIIGGLLTVLFGIVGVLVALAIFLGVGGFAWGISEGAGSAASSMLAPGTGLARPPSNSRADALEAQGDFRAAVDAWEITAGEHPEHPDPAARVARLHRDRLKDPDTALIWMKRAVERAGFGPEARVPMRELVEIARKIDDTGRAAAPLLARYAQRSGEGPEADWARNELDWIKKAIRESEGLPGD